MYSFFVALMVAAGAITATGDDTGNPVRVTVCEIRAAPDAFVGKDIRVEARYRSDRRHFSLLTDANCGSVRNTIEVGQNSSSSASELWSKWEADCRARGSEGYCVADAKVWVRGTVRQSKDGLFFDVCVMELE